MDPLVVIVVLAASAGAGILTLGMMATRLDNAQRLAELVRETRRLRVAYLSNGAGHPARSRHRR